MLSDVCVSVCLSRTSDLSREQRGLGRPTLVQRYSPRTRDSDTTFKVKVTRPLCSSPCWRVSRLQRWAWERVDRGKLLLRCRLLGGASRFGAHGGGQGRGHIVAAARLQLVYVVKIHCNLRDSFAETKKSDTMNHDIIISLTGLQTRNFDT